MRTAEPPKAALLRATRAPRRRGGRAGAYGGPVAATVLALAALVGTIPIAYLLTSIVAAAAPSRDLGFAVAHVGLVPVWSLLACAAMTARRVVVVVGLAGASLLALVLTIGLGGPVP